MPVRSLATTRSSNTLFFRSCTAPLDRPPSKLTAASCSSPSTRNGNGKTPPNEWPAGHRSARVQCRHSLGPVFLLQTLFLRGSHGRARDRPRPREREHASLHRRLQTPTSVVVRTQIVSSLAKPPPRRFRYPLALPVAFLSARRIV